MHHREVLGEAAAHEEIRQLRAEAEVQLAVAGFLVASEVPWSLAAVGRQETGIVPARLKRQRNQALLRQLVLAPLAQARLDRRQRHGGVRCLVAVPRQAVDRPSARPADDVRAPAVLGEAVGDARGQREGAAAPKVAIVVADDLFAVVERLHRPRVIAVRQAQQEPGEGQADEARLVAVSEALPGVVRGARRCTLAGPVRSRARGSWRGRRTATPPPRGTARTRPPRPLRSGARAPRPAPPPKIRSWRR